MKGTITALITPFKHDELDEQGLRENVHFQIAHGIDGLLVLGSTGECETLTALERRRMTQIVIEEAKGQVPIYVQTGNISTAQTIEQTLEAQALGADSVLIVAPYYVCPTQEGVIKHYESIAFSTSLPIVIYHHPKRTGFHFEIETLRYLATIENIVGIKDASGDVGFCAQILAATEHFALFSGDDVLTVPLLAIGAQGGFSVVSNLFPKEVADLTRCRSLEAYHRLLPLFQLSQCESNPIPIKAMMAFKGMAAGECRLPLTPLNAEHQKQLEALLSLYE